MEVETAVEEQVAAGRRRRVAAIWAVDSQEAGRRRRR